MVSNFIKLISTDLRTERFYPFVASFFISIPVYCFEINYFGDNYRELLICSFIFGILLMCTVSLMVAILTGLKTKFYERIRKTDYIFRVRNYFSWGILSAGLFSFVSLLGFSNNVFHGVLYSLFWNFSLFFCSLCFYRLMVSVLLSFSDREG